MAEEKVCSTKVISPLKQTPCEEEVVLPPKTAKTLVESVIGKTVKTLVEASIQTAITELSTETATPLQEEIIITKVVLPQNLTSSQDVVVTKVVPPPEKSKKQPVVVTKVIPSPKKPKKHPNKRKTILKGGKSLCPQCPARYDNRQAMAFHLKSEHPLSPEPRQRKTMQTNITSTSKESETPTSIVESILLQAVDAAIQTFEMVQGCKEIQEEFIPSLEPSRLVRKTSPTSYPLLLLQARSPFLLNPPNPPSKGY